MNGIDKFRGHPVDQGCHEERTEIGAPALAGRVQIALLVRGLPVVSVGNRFIAPHPFAVIDLETLEDPERLLGVLDRAASGLILPRLDLGRVELGQRPDLVATA